MRSPNITHFNHLGASCYKNRGTPKSFILFSEFHGFSMKHGPHLKRNDGFISLMEPLRQRNHDVLNIEKRRTGQKCQNLIIYGILDDISGYQWDILGDILIYCNHQ